MKIFHPRLLCGLVGLLLTGCPAEERCVPGRAEACIGIAGCSGGQQCNADGTAFGPCVCSLTGGGSATGGGGGTGGGVTGGGGGLTGGGGGLTGGGGGLTGGGGGGLTGGGGGVTGGGVGGGGGNTNDGGTPGDGGMPTDGGAALDGGPNVAVTPATLDFDRIAYFPSATPASFGVRNLTVRNTGTRPLPPDPRKNLKLGQPDGAGGFTTPYWTVTALGGASLSEICVGGFTTSCTGDLPGYDPQVGLVADAASFVVIPVRITPNGLGVRSFEIHLHTNDPDQPITTITVTATSATLPPCDVLITPPTLGFGVVAPPTFKELAFTLRNLLTGPNDRCLVSNLRVLPEVGTPPGMPPLFSVQGATDFELQPGETRQVTVRAWPQGAMPPVPALVTGRVAFTLADPVAAQRELPVSATVTTACLTISPSSFDFATVAQTCNSPTRAFQVYNTCATTVVINGAAMVLPAGEGPGGPHCSGTVPCPEFLAVSGIPLGTQVTPGSSTPVIFGLKYHPINLGPDLGAYALDVTQNGAPLQYVVPLQGRGAVTGLNVETRVTGAAKADVLLVIDDSCSMSDKQTALAQNMASLMSAATTNQIDFQVGITNTEMSGVTAAEAGVLHATPAGTRILRPNTPNFAAEFANLVNVGVTGGSESCMLPATKALTAPYITDPTKNAGFLRDDSVLAVVCVTDARDQAPQAPSFYLNQLLNIRGPQRVSQFTYNVMGPFLPTAPAGCSYDDPNDGRHEQLVSQTNGVKEEICTPDWAGALTRIGATAFGSTSNTLFLSARPDLSAPITVTVNGVLVPEIDLQPPMARHWNYDALGNSITFELFSVPQIGSTVSVSYTVPCVP